MTDTITYYPFNEPLLFIKTSIFVFNFIKLYIRTKYCNKKLKKYHHLNK